MNDAELAKAINDSGFPLQLGLLHLASALPYWQILLREHPWRDPSGDDEKFIDLVLMHGDGPVRLVIECKRARETEWLFLREPTEYHERNNRLNVRARVISRGLKAGRVIDEWIDVPFLPGSPEASYCVIRKNNQRSQELLEKSAAEIVRATNALALQESVIYERQAMSLAAVDPGIRRVYVPMIVTTASIRICDADYEKTDPETGEVTGVTAAEMPVIRFMKSLGSLDPQRSGASSIAQFAQQSERSVLVVQAAHFQEFLEKLDLSRRMPASLLEALLR